MILVNVNTNERGMQLDQSVLPLSLAFPRHLCFPFRVKNLVDLVYLVTPHSVFVLRVIQANNGRSTREQKTLRIKTRLQIHVQKVGQKANFMSACLGDP